MIQINDVINLRLIYIFKIYSSIMKLQDNLNNPYFNY
jgi:hypothetical protein